MKKVFSRGLSLFVILTLALIMCVSTAAAAPTPYASDFLNQYDGVVSSEGDGTIKISFSVVGTGIISKIGVSKIVLEKQDGQYWIPVKTYNNTKIRNSQQRTTTHTPIMFSMTEKLAQIIVQKLHFSVTLITAQL